MFTKAQHPVNTDTMPRQLSSVVFQLPIKKIRRYGAKYPSNFKNLAAEVYPFVNSTLR
jgi:hypothetical protein